WDWVTSATRGDDGRARGFNLTANQCRDPDTFNENCAWIDDRVGRLPAVTFVRERAREPGERWRIRDRDGRVDVTFEPPVPGDDDAPLSPELRRAHERALLEVAVTLESDNNFYAGITNDISEGGVFIAMDHPPPIGREIGFDLRLHEDGPVWQVIGLVRWVR